MTADEAVELGFADEVEPEMRMAALFETERLPENIRAAFAPAEPAPQPVQEPSATLAEQIEVLAKAAGFADYAPVFAVNVSSVDDAKKAIDAAREIRSLCCVAKMADKSDGFIRARKSVEDVRESLLTAMAERDEGAHTDTARRNPESPAPTPQPAALKVSDVWAARRKLKAN